MKLGKILSLIAVVAVAANAAVYSSFTVGLGTQFYTIDTDAGSYSDDIEQVGTGLPFRG